MALLLLGGAVPARATPPPVWILPIRDQATRRADAELTLALRAVVKLRARRPFRFGLPPRNECAKGCLVLEVSGTRSPSPRYALSLRRRPGMLVRSVTLQAPAGTDAAGLADAIYLKALGLLASLPPPLPPSPRRLARPAPPAFEPAAKKKQRRVSLGAGMAMMAGLDRSFLTVGAELGFDVRVIGPMMVRAAIGWQARGRCKGDPPCNYRALPFHLFAGARWQVGRWAFSAYGGVALMVLWVDFEEPVDATTAELAIGAAVELRSSVRLHDRVKLGLSLRWTFVADDLDIKIGQEENEFYQLPHVLLGLTLDLSVRF